MGFVAIRFPFNCQELCEHDRDSFELINKLWHAYDGDDSNSTNDSVERGEVVVQQALVEQSKSK